jgi:formamidopyrimidine-DNA glycosylase
LQGRRVVSVTRRGKRIAIEFEGELWLLIHLMIAGRLHFVDSGGSKPGRVPAGLARFTFETGTLILTEAGTKRRASLRLVAGTRELARHVPEGIEVLESSRERFAAQLARENHTVKRALTDPRLFAGIGNAYSDEILHRARLSPLALTRRLDEEAIGRLYHASREVLEEWTARLSREAGPGFPRKVTAFRPGMAVHGRFGEPCPVCGTQIQRIRYAANETNYCPRCQTQGRVLADRALSRLLKADWPRSIEELEER